MENALRIIIGKSPAAAREAMQTMQAVHVNSPVLQHRYNRTVEIALTDPRAVFTDEERATISEFVSVADTDTRNTILHVRLTDDEWLRLQEAAKQARVSASEYARRKLFG